MAQDISIFTRLKRLFSNDVIIRNVGGKQLKIMDTGRIQKYGNLATNSLYDRFTRMHKPVGSSLQYNPTLNYQSMRLQLYSDYEAMDHDPIIASALDIISDETTTRNEYGDVLKVNSSNENVRKVLHNLFYDVLNVEFNLATWVRNMCKYGDFYLKMEVSEKFGVYNVIPLSTYEVVREEGTDPDNPSYTRFTMDPNGLASGATNTIRRDQFTLENYEVAHFRLLTDSNYLPYGRSYLEPSRKVFKQLMLMEDAMLIHRIMRAPEKRIFYVNVGSIESSQIETFMKQTMNKMKKTPHIDQATGDYNMKFNVQNMTEDFYIPVRNNDTSTRIDTTKGLDYDGTTDIEYLKNKMMAALKIPKPFLGYEEGVEGKSTLAGMDIRFARTVERVQRIVESELTKIALVHLYSQGFSDEQLVDFKNHCQKFINGWTAHDVSLDANFELYQNRLLLFKVNEEKYNASGCSIDRQLRFVKELELVFSVELLNRLLVAYENNNQVEVVKSSQIKELLADNIISGNTLVFDNTITESRQLETNWKQPLHHTWLQKYLTK